MNWQPIDEREMIRGGWAVEMPEYSGRAYAGCADG